VRLRELIGRARAVVLSSHNADFLREHCHQVAWLDRGRLMAIGKPDDVLRDYTRHVTVVRSSVS
jgi:ABC-type polysaccharide/polyol phosphate transport system ATPase subunit